MLEIENALYAVSHGLGRDGVLPSQRRDGYRPAAQVDVQLQQERCHDRIVEVIDVHLIYHVTLEITLHPYRLFALEYLSRLPVEQLRYLVLVVKYQATVYYVCTWVLQRFPLRIDVQEALAQPQVLIASAAVHPFQLLGLHAATYQEVGLDYIQRFLCLSGDAYVLVAKHGHEVRGHGVAFAVCAPPLHDGAQLVGVPTEGAVVSQFAQHGFIGGIVQEEVAVNGFFGVFG